MKIKDMTTNHLRNRIAWMKRHPVPDPWSVHGDEPKYGAGGYMASVLEDEYDKWQSHIENMEKELESRND